MNNNHKFRAGDSDRQDNRERSRGDDGRDYDRDRRLPNGNSHGNSHGNSYGNSYGNNGGGRFGGDGGRGGGGGGRNFNGGGRNGGPPGGRGGRGGGGRGPDHSVVSELMRQYDDVLGDAACLRVISPPYSERDRSALIEGSSFSLPPLAAWRTQQPVGLQLDRVNSRNPLPIIRSNFFKVPLSTIPNVLYHYHVSMFKYRMENGELTLGQNAEDLAQKNDVITTNNTMNSFFVKNQDLWDEIGLAYDGGSSLYTTSKLPLPRHATMGSKELSTLSLEDAAALWVDYPATTRYEADVPDGRPEFCVVLNFTSKIYPPLEKWGGTGLAQAVTSNFSTGVADSLDTLRHSHEAQRALDVALLCFARKLLYKGTWFLLGNRVFSNEPARSFPLTDAFVGMMGYHASFRACLSGLALVKDISVTCFLKGGNLMQFVCAYMRCNPADLAHQLNPANRRTVDLVNLLKNCKVRFVHLQMRRKFRAFGPSASSPESAFQVQDVSMTVAQYFQNARNITLLSPHAPTVDVGSRARPMLLPLELVEIVPGQTRQRSVTGDVSAMIIKEAAMLPHRRFEQLTSKSYLFPSVQEDYDAEKFGINNFTVGQVASGADASPAAPLPMQVKGTILPPAKLLYGGNRIVEPRLAGSWNLAGGIKFAHKAPFPDRDQRGESYHPYGAVFVHGGLGRVSERDAYLAVDNLARGLERESITVGVPLRNVSQCRLADYRHADLENVLQDFKSRGARIVVVILLEENIYPRVKFLADRLCMPSQCARYSIVMKSPRNYETSLLVKMNTKMGGTNHTLASRQNVPQDPSIFQKPPQSISWLFDEPTMVIGIDVNHTEMRADGSADESVVAVVASMDGMLGQYCAHISSCNANREPVNSLYESFHALLVAFCARNHGQFPRNIIVYRDGVADSQFSSTLSSEHAALRGAVESFNLTDDFGKISFVVCQKRHHTRFFYQGAPGQEYQNSPVGLCVDSKGFGPDAANPASMVGRAYSSGPDAMGCVVGANLNEFYLNSHAAVLGTSKPTKYILLHDEIGFKMCELQLLTFWLTHLYARCTRSVSIVAPAYYAHWAAKRGRVLLAGGLMDRAGLKDMSDEWIKNKDTPAMYFI